MKNKGQEANELVLVTGLVFFAALFTVMVFGEKISNFMTSDSSVAKTAQQTATVIDSSDQQKYQPDYETSVDYEPQAPVSDETAITSSELAIDPDYTGGLTDITLGSMNLTGIPEDFNEYLQTSGSAGGSDLIAATISEYATQLEAQGVPAETINSIKELANIGHSIAQYEKEYEVKIAACGNDTSCIESAISTFDRTQIAVGDARQAYNENINSFTSQLNSGSTAYTFLNKLEEIKSDKSLSQNDINTINELAWDIGVIGEDFQNNVSLLGGTDWNHFIDPLTGVAVKEPFTGDKIEKFNTYNASKITHFDSALICANSNSEDSGTSCH